MSEKRTRSIHRAFRVAGAAVAAFGVLEVPAALLHVSVPLPPVVLTLKPGTGVLLVLAGAAVFAGHRATGAAFGGRAARGMGAALVVVAPLLVAFAGDSGPSLPVASVSALLGLAVLLLDVEVRGARCAEVLAGAALAITFLMAVGHLYGVTRLYASGGHLTTISTTIASCACAMGVLFLRPERGIAGFLAADAREGFVSRRLVSAVLGVPVLLGGLVLRGESAGVLEHALGTALLVVATVFALLCAVLWSGASLERLAADRARAREESDRLATRLRRLSDAGIVGITLADPAGLFTEANDAFLDIVGYSRDDLRAGLVRSTVMTPPHLSADLDAAAARLATSGLIPMREKEYLRKDGSRVHVLVGGAMQDGACIGVVADISRQKEFEARLLATQDELATTLDSMGDALIATDTDGAVTRMNPVAEKLTGWPLGEAMGRKLDEVFRITNEDTGQPVESPVERVLREGVVVGLANHTALTARDGTARPIADSAAPIRDARGRLRGVVLVFRDMTDEKTAEQALERSRTRFARTFEAGVVGIVVSDASSKLTEVNDAFLRIIGYSRDDLLAGRIRAADLTPPEWQQAQETAFAQLKAAGTTQPWEKELLRKDGRRVPVLIVVTRLDGENLLSVVTDLTELKRAERDRATLDTEARSHSTARERAEAALHRTEEQLRQSQKMDAVGRLAGGVAHDFNNVLSVILSYAEMLLGDAAVGKSTRDDVEEIRRAARRAADLTRQLLMFSRQEALDPKILDVNEVVTGAESMLRRLVGEDIELIATPGPSLGKVCADRGSLEQLIMNLVVNARDAMPTGGKLTIETANVNLDEAYAREHLDAKPGPHVLLAISDTGTGMDRATQATIFEPFFTTKEKGKGTGLGLSTVFGIVRHSGGSIGVYSELGRGTTFKVYLPAVTAASEKPRPATAPPARRGSELILLVEDEEQVRVVARTILERQGYRVVEAHNAAEALLLSENHVGTIDLLLSDVVMPQMSGPELAKRLAAARPSMKILCMSGYTDDAVVRHGTLEGGIAFLQKPFTPETLSRKVREVLDAPDASATEPTRS